MLASSIMVKHGHFAGISQTPKAAASFSFQLPQFKVALQQLLPQLKTDAKINCQGILASVRDPNF